MYFLLLMRNVIYYIFKLIIIYGLLINYYFLMRNITLCTYVNSNLDI